MREKYESLSLATLKDLAKARGLKGISTLRKPELIDRMLQEDEREAAVQKETSPKTQESVQTEKAEEPVREQRNFDNPEERPLRHQSDHAGHVPAGHAEPDGRAVTAKENQNHEKISVGFQTDGAGTGGAADDERGLGRGHGGRGAAGPIRRGASAIRGGRLCRGY